jgi:hypothetical protein
VLGQFADGRHTPQLYDNRVKVWPQVFYRAPPHGGR